MLGPAGRVHATLGDYARFLSLYVGGSEGFLKPRTLTHLLTPAPGSDYAGGWGVGTGAAGRVLTHEGSNTLWHAIASLYPERGVGYAAVVNEGGSRGRAAAVAILDRLREDAASA